MDDNLMEGQIRIAYLEKLLDEERSQSNYYKMMAQEKGKQYLHEISRLSNALAKHRQMEKNLRESEERYRIAIEHSHDGVSIISDSIHIYVNRRFLEIFGYDNSDYLLGKAATLVVQDNDRERVEGFITARLKGEPTPSRCEFRGMRKEGSPIDIEAVVTTITYKGENAILACLRDIGERRRIEEEFMKASKLESVGVLAGGIAHDFNNIMTAIMGNISLAKLATRSDERSSQCLVEAEQAANRAKDLARQFITFSKGGAPIKRITEIGHLLEDSINFTLTGSNVKGRCAIPPDLWNVDVDEGQMNQAIQNLTINAKEAMPKGGIIEVTAENAIIDDDQGPDGLLLKKGTYIKIAIKDSGIGIPEEHIDKIFDPFFTTKPKGSGLGLATSYSIVRKHGGLLQVKSYLGIGTTFTIYLPATERKALTAMESKLDISRGKGKILLMDDEEMVREAISEMLSFLGYRTESAKDGAEAIDLYAEAMKKKEPFDMVILDLTVPGGMGGQEAMEEFLAIDPNIKAIVSSGYANNRIMSEYKNYGFVAVITKPYKLEELGEAVSRAMMNKA
ncbi:MAG: PAS domain S-box protein [Syntrophobacterales bacterium]|nr:PAS domain S-box protein [Syntrophobacterales bacterium]